MEFDEHIVPDLEDVIAETNGASLSMSIVSGVVGSSNSNVATGVTADTVDTDASFEVIRSAVVSDHLYVDPSVSDRALLEAHVSNSKAALPKFCWEEGVLGEVFGSDNTHIPNILNLSVQPPDLEPATSSATVALPLAGTLKRKSDDSFYTSAVKVINDADFFEQEKQLWNSALCKWQTVFCIVHHSGPVGDAVWNATTSGDMDNTAHRVLRDVFGVKSPRTVMKSASSILAFFHWLQKHGLPVWPFDNDIDNFAVYIGDFAIDRKGFPRGSSLLQACRFAHHVLQIDMSRVLNDKRFVRKN